jgi:hypothetical protein
MCTARVVEKLRKAVDNEAVGAFPILSLANALEKSALCGSVGRSLLRFLGHDLQL